MANKRIKDLPAFSGTLPNNAAFAIDAGQATQKVEFSTLKNAVAPIGTKSITANGTYPASGDSLYGYSEVEVDVPNTYVTGDAGKVVQDGALVAQTSKTVTQNGTYNTTTNNQVIVNVPQPVVGTKSITVNGTYNASSDHLAGYNQVNVNVPNSATLIAKNITQNGTYNASSDNADGYSSVTVNVSGGGGSSVTWFCASNVTVTPPSAQQAAADDLIYTVLESSSGDASGSAWVVNSNSWIDLTNINSIFVCVFLGNFETNVSNPFVGVASQQISSFEDISQCAVSIRLSTVSGSGDIIKLDVSSLTGSYYLVAAGKLTYGSYGWVRTKFAAIAV